VTALSLSLSIRFTNTRVLAQHKLIAPHGTAGAAKGWSGVDKILCEMHAWLTSTAFVRSYGSIFPRASHRAAYSLYDAEIDPKNAVIIGKYEVTLRSFFNDLSSARESNAAFLKQGVGKKGPTVVSNFFGEYPASFLGGEFYMQSF
jgi:hypothetical protein